IRRMQVANRVPPVRTFDHRAALGSGITDDARIWRVSRSCTNATIDAFARWTSAGIASVARPGDSAANSPAVANVRTTAVCVSTRPLFAPRLTSDCPRLSVSATINSGWLARGIERAVTVTLTRSPSGGSPAIDNEPCGDFDADAIAFAAARA